MSTFVVFVVSSFAKLTDPDISFVLSVFLDGVFNFAVDGPSSPPLVRTHVAVATYDTEIYVPGSSHHKHFSAEVGIERVFSGGRDV